MVKPTGLSFEEFYGDGSGPEYAVRSQNGKVEFESIGEVIEFPLDKIEWLIDALEFIKDTIATPEIEE